MLLRKRCHRATVAEAPERRSRKARLWQAFMLVLSIYATYVVVFYKRIMHAYYNEIKICSVQYFICSDWEWEVLVHVQGSQFLFLRSCHKTQLA